MANGFAAFSFQKAVFRKIYADFVKKIKITKFLLNVSRTQFSFRFCCMRVCHDVTNEKRENGVKH